jgi:hypothetical protein
VKKYLSKIFATIGIMAVVVLAIGAGTNARLGGTDQATSKYVGTYANSAVDTIRWSREGSCSALAFAVHMKDSAAITNVIVRRIVDGKVTKAVAGDTLSALGFTSITNDSVATATVTLTPLSDELWFFVTYAGSGNGVTTPTVTYEAIKQFSRR